MVKTIDLTRKQNVNVQICQDKDVGVMLPSPCKNVGITCRNQLFRLNALGVIPVC